LWINSRALQVPVHKSIEYLIDLPYTISFVFRKRIQVDNLSELPKEKRPPDKILWDGTADEIDKWLDKVFDRKEKPDGLQLSISDAEIEG